MGRPASPKLFQTGRVKTWSRNLSPNISKNQDVSKMVSKMFFDMFGKTMFSVKLVSLKVFSKHLGHTPLKTPPGLLAVAVAASTFGSTFGSGSAVTGASSTKGRAVLRNMSAVLDAMTLAQPDQVERLGWGNDAKAGNWTAREEQLWNVLQLKLGVVTKFDQIQYMRLPQMENTVYSNIIYVVWKQHCFLTVPMKLKLQGASRRISHSSENILQNLLTTRRNPAFLRFSFSGDH